LIQCEYAILDRFIVVVCTREDKIFLPGIDRKGELSIPKIPHQSHATSGKGSESGFGKGLSNRRLCGDRQKPANVISGGVSNSEIPHATYV